MSNEDAFARWFTQATGNERYPFQIRFADGDWLPEQPRWVPVPDITMCRQGWATSPAERIIGLLG